MRVSSAFRLGSSSRRVHRSRCLAAILRLSGPLQNHDIIPPISEVPPCFAARIGFESVGRSHDNGVDSLLETAKDLGYRIPAKGDLTQGRNPGPRPDVEVANDKGRVSAIANRPGEPQRRLLAICTCGKNVGEYGSSQRRLVWIWSLLLADETQVTIDH